VVGRGGTSRLERRATIGQSFDERGVVADLAPGGGFQLGQRRAPAGCVERDGGVGAEGRPDAATESAMLLE